MIQNYMSLREPLQRLSRLPLSAGTWAAKLLLAALLFASALPPQQAVAQQKAPSTVKGVVRTENGLPVAGVSVVIKGTLRGTTTDAKGAFAIQAKSADVLVFSFIGYQTAEIRVGAQTHIEMVLSEQATELDDVVVIGYGTAKKSDLSGAVASIRADDVMKGTANTSINQALQGRLAGVTVSQNDGAPGSGVNINIRGVNTFLSNSQPLYVVDGIPFDPPATPRSAENTDNSAESVTNAMAFINPHDIASIEVLKDASATAIYGSRGANGVILITTKKGTSRKPVVEFSANMSISKVRKTIPVLNGYEFATYRNEQQENGFIYDGVPYREKVFPGRFDFMTSSDGTVIGARYKAAPEDYLNPGWVYGTDPAGREWRSWVEGTDWQDEIFQIGISQEYNIQVSGATDKGNYAFSGNYTSQDGTIKNTGYDRFTLRANISQEIVKGITAGINLSYANAVNNFAKSNSMSQSFLRSALMFPSTISKSDFSQNEELASLVTNPISYVDNAKNQLTSDNVFSSAFVSIKLAPGLTFRQNLGLSYFANERSTYYNRETGEGFAPTINGRGGYSDNVQRNLTEESMLTYANTFNKIHNLNIVGAVTFEQTAFTSKTMSGTNFPSDITENYDMGAALNPGPLVTDKRRNRLFSLLGRINYVLKDRYIFTASFRRDGSSKFSKSNRWSNFASGAIAWRISEEPFIKRLEIFDNLKLRASFGQTGNQGIPDYLTSYMMQMNKYVFSGKDASGYRSGSAFNPNLRWETTDQYNVGLDIGVLKNRINLTVEYYYKNTKDLLQNFKIPESSGFTNQMMNQGRVTNEGLEIQGNFRVLERALSWSIDANISFNRNRIKDMPHDQFATRLWYSADNAFIFRNDCPVGSIYGYVEDGFYDNEAEVRANPDYANATDATVKSMIGEVKYREGQHIIGNTNPDYTFGMTHNFSWKNLSFGFFLQGMVGNDIFNGNLQNITLSSPYNITRDAYKTRWTPENREHAKWPKASNQVKRTWLVSDRYVEDGSYLRLKNVNIGYTFNRPKFCKHISSINIYASVTNLFTITGYSWYDPDVNAFGGDASRRGVDIYSYPTSRTFSFGVKVQF
ncbi:SusC/RagA family TonB-linked outer membrane protein [Alistipes timonensis]